MEEKTENHRGMGNVLLVKLSGGDGLLRVNTSLQGPFKAWVDDCGCDLWYKGRFVDEIHTPSEDGAMWWPVHITSAVRAMLKRGDAVKVDSQPEVEELNA